MKTLEERFFSKVNKTDTCWEWIGCKDKCGYGLIYHKNKKNINTHRLSYILHNGNIDENYCICHSCDNPSCVNPEHLFLGTHKDNMKDKSNKGRVRNNNGYGEENHNSKLTKMQVNEIYDLLQNGLSQSEIAKIYNVSQGLISAIKLNKIWVNKNEE